MLLAGIATSAQADAVDLQLVDYGAGRNIRVRHEGLSWDTFAGQLVHQMSNGTGQFAGMNGTCTTFCTDLLQSVSNFGSTYTAAEVGAAPNGLPMGAAKAAAINNLYSFAAGRQFESGSTAGARNFAGAFQIAIWEVVADYDGSLASLDHTLGDFRATKVNGSSLNGGMQKMLGDLFESIGRESSHSDLMALTSEGAQDQLVVMPVPAAVLLGGLGLGGVVAFGRRRFTQS
jgi:hypothetical protein